MNVEEVLNFYRSHFSQYEKTHGITGGDWLLFQDYEDIKFYLQTKTDHSFSFLMIFRAGKTDNWCGWIINKQQASTLINHFPAAYKTIQQINVRLRNT